MGKKMTTLAISLPSRPASASAASFYGFPFLAAVAVAVVIFTVTWRADPLRIINSSFESDSAHVGQQITLRQEINWRRNCLVDSSKFFVRKNTLGEVIERVPFIEAKRVPQPESLGYTKTAESLVVPQVPSYGLWYYRTVDRGVCWPWEIGFPLGPIVSDTPLTVLAKDVKP